MTALVIGIGNRLRGDDGAGPEVAARVAALGVPGVTVVVEEEPLALVDHLAGHDEVVVVDAVAPRGKPGRVLVLRVGADPLPEDAHALGTHGLGVAEAVELARSLRRLPRRLTLVGVEAEDLSHGGSLSAQVGKRLGDAVEAVLDALPSEVTPRPSGCSSGRSTGPWRRRRRPASGSA